MVKPKNNSLKKSYPMISIVTVSYNQGEYIEQNILSVLAQKYPNFEHIVADGGSKDNTLKILKKYKHLKWISEPDKGQTNAMNKGLKMAKGDIIYLLNSDDMCEPASFDFVSDYFTKNPQSSIVYGDCRVIDEKNNDIEVDKTEEFNLHKHLNLGNMLWQEATFFKRNVLSEVGLLNEDCRYAMDYDFWCRVAKKFTLHKTHRVLGRFRVHSESKSTLSDEIYRKEVYAVSVKHGGSRLSPIFLSRYGPIVRNILGQEFFAKFSSTYNSIKKGLWNTINRPKSKIQN